MGKLKTSIIVLAVAVAAVVGAAVPLSTTAEAIACKPVPGKVRC